MTENIYFFCFLCVHVFKLHSVIGNREMKQCQHSEGQKLS